MKIAGILVLSGLIAAGCGATQETRDLSHELLSPGGYIDQRLELDDRIIVTYRDLLEFNKEEVTELTLANGQTVPTQQVIDALNNIIQTTPPITDGTHALNRYTQAGVNAEELLNDIVGQIDVLAGVAKLFAK